MLLVYNYLAVPSYTLDLTKLATDMANEYSLIGIMMGRLHFQFTIELGICSSIKTSIKDRK
jgi:hypothetical protein